MYKNPQFEEKDTDKLVAFMQAHSFITLIGYDGDYPVATQVPVKIENREDKIVLIGHVMKKTDHHQACAKNENVLALFTGAHAYISASVYRDPAVASTWNYSAVQAKGKIKLLNEAETREVIKELTNSYENPETSKAAFHHMSEDYIEKNLKAISGFEISVESMTGVFKLSQNHPAVNRENIINHLASSNDANDQQVAEDMKKV
ncbi:FMN-binding negative transcriptional regulator [Pedobacter sp. Du54]|uniref:FMN-binding negative transcriptional regulator n=1 Tax=Pedobacter anseongensis TaxID=3133439 RepID=UPI00309873E0